MTQLHKLVVGGLYKIVEYPRCIVSHLYKTAPEDRYDLGAANIHRDEQRDCIALRGGCVFLVVEVLDATLRLDEQEYAVYQVLIKDRVGYIVVWAEFAHKAIERLA